jgi:hypothetical protein
MKKTVNGHADYIVQIFVAIKENRQDIFFSLFPHLFLALGKTDCHDKAEILLKVV